MAKRERSAYSKRYARYRHRIAAWRRMSDAMAALALPMLYMLVEQDDMVAVLGEAVREDPGDGALRKDYLEAIRCRQRALEMIASAPGVPTAG